MSLGWWLVAAAWAQQPASSELLGRIQAMRTVGSVLYVAAHPDDENTRLLAHLVGERGLSATYLSLTRGGGGQNLVGQEQSELLGVVRTGELLAARSIDGASQRFTRARDFGYSKSAEESLAVWGHDEVLADVVRVVREVRPDVIVTRFGPTDDTHGHHVASAILAEEAFAMAADPAVLTEGLPPWRADRIVRNQSSWRIDDTTDTSGWMKLDVGGFDPLTGRSWGEVAAASRTMHKSQGFGSAPSVGPQLEYFSGVAGAVPPVDADLFDGLDLTWSRVQGGAAVDKALRKASRDFEPGAPYKALVGLAKAHAAVSSLKDWRGRTEAMARIEGLMVDCAGLWLTARADQPEVRPGQTVPVTLTALQRGGGQVALAGTSLTGASGESLQTHSPWTITSDLVVAADQALSQPHWLRRDPTPAMYAIDDGPQRTAAELEPALTVTFALRIAGRVFDVKRPVLYAWTDRVMGERSHPVEVLPAVTASPSRPVRLVPNGERVPATITLRSHGGDAEGTLRLIAPAGGSVEPEELSFLLTKDAPEQVVMVSVSAGEGGMLQAEVEVDGVRSSWSRTVIDHPHLTQRTVLAPAQMRLVPLELNRGPTQRIGYLQGSGDAVDSALDDLGYTVEALSIASIRDRKLDGYDAVVLGIRAFNTHPELLDVHPQLLDYVAGGGRVLVQYNTSSRWTTLPTLGPAPMSITRGRVTDEKAEMTVLDPSDPVVNVPNVLGASDYADWVQERGLYFADGFEAPYRPVFRMNDAGEEPLDGSIIVAQHGQGVFVYAGLSWFRQLPAGVPGAARLLANVLALTVEPTVE